MAPVVKGLNQVSTLGYLTLVLLDPYIPLRAIFHANRLPTKLINNMWCMSTEINNPVGEKFISHEENILVI